MGTGRRYASGASGGGRALKRLRDHVESCRLEYPTVDDAVYHLRDVHPVYRRMKIKDLTRLVAQIHQSSTHVVLSTPKTSKRRFKDGSDDEHRHSSQPRKTRKRNEESEESDSSSQLEIAATSSAVSTSEDAIFEEKVEPEFDLMQLMLRKSYAGKECKEKNLEVDVTSNTKTMQELVISGNKRKELKIEGTVSGSSVDETGKAGPWFKDLGGMQEVLKELEMEVLVPLYHPHVPMRLGVKPVNGILLHGPPGCGKTKLAHAIANETGLPFYKISATEIVSGVSGASEENIRDLFSKARRTAPSIVFIDEIDAIASKRENLQREMERRIVTQLMTCMDEYQEVGQSGTKNACSDIAERKYGAVLVIGATNRPDALDPALRRPGRFDREIGFGVPDEKERVEILSVLTRSCIMEGSVNLFELARLTSGFVGADLDALINKAGNLSMRRIINERKCKLSAECALQHSDIWWKVPWSPEEIERLAIGMADFQEAAIMVQPSARREGFSTIPNVKWDDVGGLDSIRHEFNVHVIKRIKFPELYQNFGLNMETGILLYGPPGCGKTLVAKAVANEAGANFIHVKGPELLDKYVGESELAVRTLFHRARTCSPCIIFFDEVDALTTRRGKEGGWVVERVLIQLLTELDGVEQRQGVVVIGATNRPEVIDPAVLRPGRFGKRLYIPLPSPDDRGLILKALAKKKPVDPSVDLQVIGQLERCDNFSGADLNNLLNEAAMAALQDATRSDCLDSSSCVIKACHFDQAFGKISPSVSLKQIQYYKVWSQSFMAT